MKNYKLLQKIDRSVQVFRRSGIYARMETELTDADIMVLFCIRFNSEEAHVKLTDIAKTLGVTLPAITHKVNDLEKMDYLAKEASTVDLRVTHILLTNKGKEYVDSIKDSYYKPIEILMDRLGEEDTETFLRLLEKMTKAGKLK
ncbi:MAG: winged helix DNA-binding protein [Acholeplasmataceae bacterium]